MLSRDDLPCRKPQATPIVAFLSPADSLPIGTLLIRVRSPLNSRAKVCERFHKLVQQCRINPVRSLPIRGDWHVLTLTTCQTLVNERLKQAFEWLQRSRCGTTHRNGGGRENPLLEEEGSVSRKNTLTSLTALSPARMIRLPETRRARKRALARGLSKGWHRSAVPPV